MNKRRGRPPGAKTQDLPTVQVVKVPATCPHCGHDKREVVTVVRNRTYSQAVWVRDNTGVLLLASRIKWRRCRCCSCHQLYNEQEIEPHDAS